MKKILIISNSYPNFGGQSTTAYNLLKLLTKHGFDANVVYINPVIMGKGDWKAYLIELTQEIEQGRLPPSLVGYVLYAYVSLQL